MTKQSSAYAIYYKRAKESAEMLVAVALNEVLAKKLLQRFINNNVALNKAYVFEKESLELWEQQHPVTSFGPMPSPETRGFTSFKELFANPEYCAVMEQRRITTLLRDKAFNKIKAEIQLKARPIISGVFYIKKDVEDSLANELVSFTVKQVPLILEDLL